MDSIDEIRRLARYRSGQCDRMAKMHERRRLRVATRKLAKLWKVLAAEVPSMTLAQAQEQVRELQDLERIASAGGSIH